MDVLEQITPAKKSSAKKAVSSGGKTTQIKMPKNSKIVRKQLKTSSANSKNAPKAKVTKIRKSMSKTKSKVSRISLANGGNAPGAKVKKIRKLASKIKTKPPVKLSLARILKPTTSIRLDLQKLKQQVCEIGARQQSIMTTQNKLVRAVSMKSTYKWPVQIDVAAKPTADSRKKYGNIEL